MVQFALFGQTVYGTDDGYNPDNPGNPGEPALKHTIELVASPQNGGSFNFTSQKVVEGSDVYLYAYPNSHYAFKGWMQGDSLLSTARSFYYNMPKHDVTITGLFEFGTDYDPENPGNPGDAKVKHTLTVAALPNNGGNFNFNEARVAEGESIDIYAYTNTGFEFKGWQVDGEIVSTNRSYYYTMGQKDANVTGVFVYNPTNPGNPNKNYWDASTGHVIVDDFEPGELYSAIYDVTNGNNSAVTMITVAGRMENYDFGIANNYESCTLVDLSRAYGFTEIPSYAYDYNTSLSQIIIPSCVEKIGYRAFYQCSNLAEISCYAVVPPTVDSYAFEGIAEGAVLRVLSSSISLYAEADGWKDFTILPLSEEVRNLEVSLPADAADGRYKNMTLELVNVASGQRQKYVISDRLVYTFNSLLLDSEFEVYVRNGSDDVLGCIKGVKIEDEDVKVAFESLLQPQNVALKVMTPDGQDVTAQTLVTWLKADQTYLKQGAQLTGVLPETQVSYRINLPQTLGMEYILPKDSTYIVQTADNNVVYVLEPIAPMTVSGKVRDLTTNALLQNAVISVSQKLNGLYNKSYIVKTNNKGEYSVSVLKDKTTITVSAADYVSKTVEVSALNDTVVLDDIALKSITGAVITTNFTFTNSVKEGETAEVQNWYEDYVNVAYSIYNVTQNKPISDFNVQYPNIVLLEEVAENDRLRITATSKTNAFVPVEAEGVIDSLNRASVTLDVVDLGAINAKFTSTDNALVVGILYNGSGQLMKKYTYSNATLNISDLADGKYTLVSMANSTLFNSIYNLSQFAGSGLVEGTDYVQNTVTVKSGVVSVIENEMIPVLDESKLYYTGNNTSFSVNKTSIVAGNYLTLSGKIDFKSAYADKISDVKMVIDIPESASFVENSVMVGSCVASYTLDGSRITIPLENFYSQVRFCIIPTEGGEFAPNAFASFSLEGKEVLQPIGSANYAVKDLSIVVPSIVATTTIQVSGTAIGKSDIVIYDGDIQIGQTTSLANGIWSATCELNEPYNLSTHRIYAKVKTKTDIELNSETVDVELNRSHASPKTLLMTFYNGWLHKNVDVTFDFINLTIDNPGYMFYTKTKLSFVADFTDNNPEKLTDVILWILSSNNTETAIALSYDATSDKWIGSHDFDYYTAPVNVALEYSYKGQEFFDRKQLSDFNEERESVLVDNLAERAEFIATFDAEMPEDEVTKRLTELFSQEEPDEEEIRRLLNMYGEADSTAGIGISDEEFNALCQQADSSWIEWDTNGAAKMRETVLADYYADPAYDMLSDYEITSELENGTKTVSKKKLTSVNREELEANGYSAIMLDDGSEIYVLYSESLMEIIDCGQLMKYSIIVEQSDASAKYAPTRVPVGNYLAYAHAAKNAIQSIYSLSTTDKRRWLVEVAKKIDEATDGISKFYESFMNDFNKNVQAAYNGLNVLSDQKIEDQEVLAEAAEERIKEYTEKIEANKAQRDVMRHNRDVVKNSTTLSEKEKERLIKEYDEGIQKLTDENKSLNGKRAGSNAQLKSAKSRIASIKEKSTKFRMVHTKIRETLDKFPKRLVKGLRMPAALRICGKVAGELGIPLQCWSLFADLMAMSDDIKDWLPLMDGIDAHTCYKKGDANAISLHESIFDRANWHAWHNVGILSSELSAIGFSLAGGVPGSPTWWAEMGISAVAELWKFCNDRASLNERTLFWTQVGSLKCDDKEDDKDNKLPPKNNKHNYPFNPANPIHDPSGFVYEGVTSNRLEGVTATCFYKEYVEDMYGDKHENVVLWNAEEYAQENPLFTDENGYYRWDVPQGLWQVKFEKEGYQTTYSEWLPVPPPQLEVNIAMTQSRQPEVKTARAYEDAIEVEFDKYMQIESLNTDNVILTKNGEKVAGTVKLMNEEVAYEGNATTYASKLRFIPEETLLTTDEVALTVSSKVKSYAGVQMESDYTQDFDIEKEVKSLTVDSITIVGYNDTRTVTISAVPYDAAIGKKVVASSSSSMILTLAADTLTFDENGQAEVVVSGELPGAAAVTFRMPDSEVSAMTKVEVVTNVSNIPEKPQASRASGTAVYRNTEIALSCETEDVVIYYTTDGTCPCDENGTRKVYEKPIVIDTDTMTIKAMAKDKDGTESETAEFTYTLKTTKLTLDLKEGWNWMSHNVETEITVDKVKTNANRVVGQTAEITNDPKYGLVGNLHSLSPEEMYKVEVTANTAHTIEGYAYNPEQPIELKEGWNWMGYPLSQILSVTEAFANAVPAEEDLIFGQDGFAQYVDGAWTGILETLNPGQGYMYYSKEDKNFVYNAAIVSKANALRHKGIGVSAPWAVNKYQYPNIMCLVAEVYQNGIKAEAGEYYVGAFCGTECRGIGKNVDGLLMMSIYGEGGEEISFMAMDKDNETLFTINETEKFAVTMLGGVKSPYSLTIGDATTSIAGVNTGCKVWPIMASTQIFISGKGERVDKVMVTDMNGEIVVVKRNVPNGGAINISALPKGMYVVTVICGSNTFYQKIVKVADM